MRARWGAAEWGGRVSAFARGGKCCAKPRYSAQLQGVGSGGRTRATGPICLVLLVRVYRLFIHAADPADFVGLFNPFLDWLSVHRADERPQIETAIEEFVTNLSIR